MEPTSPMTRHPRYAEISIQATSTGLNEFIRVFRGGDGDLHTQTFFEKPNHGGEVDFYKPVDWKEKVPPGAVLRGCNGGSGSGAIPNYWVTWREPGTFKALSIYQEAALEAPMQAQDSLIDGPLVDLDGKLHAYFLRKAPEGYELWEHLFTGEAKKKGHVSTAKLGLIAGEPLFIRADPIARLEGFKDGGYRTVVAGIAVIGWLTRDGANLRAHAAWIDAAGVKQFASDAIAGYAPFPHQRIGLWANPDSSRLHLAWIMGRTDSDTLRSAEWTLWEKTGTQNIRIDSRGLGGSKVHSVASVILRNDYTPDTYCYYLTRTGKLYEQNRSETKKIREDVPLDYDFPIYASSQAPWEARMDGHGELYFYLPSWMGK